MEQAVAQASSLSFSSHKQAGSLFYSFASAINFEEPLLKRKMYHKRLVCAP